jgi:hypothetical protein
MIDINTLCSTIKTEAVENLIDFKDIKILTRPNLPTPEGLPALYIMPGHSDKIQESDEWFYHVHTLELMIINWYVTTPEESLSKESLGLLARMVAVEAFFENRMLDLLHKLECVGSSYSVSERDFAPNIYCRAGSLNYIATTKPYCKAKT